MLTQNLKKKILREKKPRFQKKPRPYDEPGPKGKLQAWPSGKFSSQMPVSATVPSNSSTSYSLNKYGDYGNVTDESCWHHDPNKVPSKISKQGIGMLMSPSSVTTMLSLEPNTISLYRVTWVVIV